MDTADLLVGTRGSQMYNFRSLLDGFHEMDEHFRKAPFESNLPVLMGLLAVWHNDWLK